MKPPYTSNEIEILKVIRRIAAERDGWAYEDEIRMAIRMDDNGLHEILNHLFGNGAIKRNGEAVFTLTPEAESCLRAIDDTEQRPDAEGIPESKVMEFVDAIFKQTSENGDAVIAAAIGDAIGLTRYGMRKCVDNLNDRFLLVKEGPGLVSLTPYGVKLAVDRARASKDREPQESVRNIPLEDEFHARAEMLVEQDYRVLELLQRTTQAPSGGCTISELSHRLDLTDSKTNRSLRQLGIAQSILVIGKRGREVVYGISPIGQELLSRHGGPVSHISELPKSTSDIKTQQTEKKHSEAPAISDEDAPYLLLRSLYSPSKRPNVPVSIAEANKSLGFTHERLEFHLRTLFQRGHISEKNRDITSITSEGAKWLFDEGERRDTDEKLQHREKSLRFMEQLNILGGASEPVDGDVVLKRLGWSIDVLKSILDEVAPYITTGHSRLRLDDGATSIGFIRLTGHHEYEIQQLKLAIEKYRNRLDESKKKDQERSRTKDGRSTFNFNAPVQAAVIGEGVTAKVGKIVQNEGTNTEEKKKGFWDSLPDWLKLIAKIIGGAAVVITSIGSVWYSVKHFGQPREKDSSPITASSSATTMSQTKP